MPDVGRDPDRVLLPGVVRIGDGLLRPVGIDGPGRFKHSTGGDLRPSAVRREPAVKGVAVPRGRWKGRQLAVLRRAADGLTVPPLAWKVIVNSEG